MSSGLLMGTGLLIQRVIRMRAVILLCLSLGATQVLADTPFYAGVGGGITTIRQDVAPNFSTPNINERSTGYQLFGGWEINSRWALELGYIDFGEVEDTTMFTPPNFPPNVMITDTLQFEAWGYYLNAQYHIPVGDFGSFDLTGGWFIGDSETRQFDPNSIGPVNKIDHNDSGLMVGAAFTLKATDQIYVRAKLDYFNIDYDNVIENPYRAGIDVIWDF